MRYVLIFILFATVLGPVQAQTIEPCERAAEWLTAYVNVTLTIMSGTQYLETGDDSTVFEMSRTYNEIEDIYIVLESLDYPVCAEIPRKYLLDSTSYFLESLEMLINDEDVVAAYGPVFSAALAMGQGLGYFEALNVEPLPGNQMEQELNRVATEVFADLATETAPSADR